MTLKELTKKAYASKAEKVPPAFKTVKDFAKAENLSNSQALRLVKNLTECDPPMLEQKMFKLYVSGCLRSIAHYRKLR